MNHQPQGLQAMLNTVRAAAGTVTAGIITTFLLPPGLSAQECSFEGNPAAASAAQIIQAIDPDAADAENRAAYEEAWEALSADIDSDNPYVWLLAAQLQIERGNFDDAAQRLDRYDELAPPECVEHGQNQRFNGWVRLYNEGAQAYGEGRLEDALSSFLLANDFRPDVRSYSSAGQLLEATGDNAGAVELYRTALAADLPVADESELESLRSIVRNLSALLMADGRSAEAADVYAEMLADHPDDVGSLIRYAGVLAAQGRSDDASEIYAETLRRTDLSYEQWVEVGVGLHGAESFADAATAFGNARAQNPYNKEAMENFVNASIQAGRAESVIAVADTLKMWYPHDQSAHQLHSFALVNANRNEEALEVNIAEEALPIVFTATQMAAMSGGRYLVQVDFTAREGAGSLDVEFHFLDIGGAIVITERRTLDPAAGTLSFDVRSETPVAGFRYEANGG